MKTASATLLPSQIHPQLQQNLTNQSKNNSLAKSRLLAFISIMSVY